MSILTVDNVTEALKLHQVSAPTTVENATPAIEELVKTIPEEALGLSAPQIGIFDRVFITRLFDGFYAFVNPSFEPISSRQFTSNEGCLSVPGETRQMTRYQDIKVEADAIYTIEDTNSLTLLSETKEFYQGDAAIFQHELDHLEGILITDKRNVEVLAIPSLDVSPFLQEAAIREAEIRATKRNKKKKRKSGQKIKSIKMSLKNKAKLKKILKTSDKRRKKRVEVEEYQKAVEAGTISND